MLQPTTPSINRNTLTCVLEHVIQAQKYWFRIPQWKRYYIETTMTAASSYSVYLYNHSDDKIWGARYFHNFLRYGRLFLKIKFYLFDTEYVPIYRYICDTHIIKIIRLLVLWCFFDNAVVTLNKLL